MKQRKWRGTTLFLSILAVLGATFGLKFYSTGSQPIATTSQSAAGTGSTSTDSSGAAPSPSPSGTSAAAPAPSPSAAASTAVQTVTGNAVQTRFGNVQVKVTFSGKTITKIDVLQVPQESGRDQEIASYSVPILQQEVLQSQSARVDSVSGATYTSDGYLQSVQSAIDKLG
ncbi:MAG: hypothetical protein JWM49_2204 [Microbacteriaceae bacterium]|jgi:uncharacterized protein with FMN-binding domain|nr:hypothetical protein [Microbacteriaceae bacterium]